MQKIIISKQEKNKVLPPNSINSSNADTNNIRQANKLTIAWGPDIYNNLRKEEEAYNNNITSSEMAIDTDNYSCPLVPTSDVQSHIMEIDVLTSITKEQDKAGLVPISGFY